VTPGTMSDRAPAESTSIENTSAASTSVPSTSVERSMSSNTTSGSASADSTSADSTSADSASVDNASTDSASTDNSVSVAARFRAEYGAHRAAEGRGHAGAELLALPYLRNGPLAKQWAVRARTFDAFVAHVLRPLTIEMGRPLAVLDLGAGNGWLSRRAALDGHDALAMDVRDDDVDGLGAARGYPASGEDARFHLAAASFEALPLRARSFDVAVFNASLHYATDLAAVIAEAARVVRGGGCIAILDSPFYRSDAAGEAMVAEKRAQAAQRFGGRAGALLALPFVEYLTAARLAEASAGPGLAWRRRRVRYPAWYEARPLLARIRGQRIPSRFDLWTARVP